MILLDIFCLLVGAVLAQRYKVTVLLPATALVLIAAVGTGLTQSYALERMILIAAGGSASLQAGYLFGLGLRYLLEAPSTESPQRLQAGTTAYGASNSSDLNRSGEAKTNRSPQTVTSVS